MANTSLMPSSTKQGEGNPLMTVERGDGSRVNIFIDPNCPDYSRNFLRPEGDQTSSCTHHGPRLDRMVGGVRTVTCRST
ncbi:hypothetical protein AAFF_G00262730 [Aldrovandia affinis]|uniref:Uncharacterized protein n=1 Tax=Aldrovandia affinis TaxID=143900 RepID=A0AAD7WT50_9TELE|nr:hypothetical protein AAFF_G00262730 [Aldrovandia affinis]